MKFIQVTKLIPIILVLLLCFFFYHETIFLFPSHIHAWTQSDRYALSLCFLQNGMDFFHPCTFNLQTIDGITRVDFPINEYLIAIVMKITGSTSPFIFRLFMLIYSLTGLFFLFKLVYKISGSFWLGLMIVLFVFFSPVYLYYQNGFVPSIIALANIFIASYFFYCYQQKKFFKHLLLAALFFLIAALERMPFVISVATFSICLFADWFKQKRICKKEMLLMVISSVIFILYNLYTIHLGRKYGTMFLTSFMRAHSFKEVNEINHLVYKSWFFEYFSGWQWAIILGCAFILFLKKQPDQNLTLNPLKLFTVSYALLSSAYFFSMQFQFIHHDYYFLDSFYTPLVFVFIIASANKFFSSKAGLLLLFALLTGSGYSAFKSYSKRYEDASWDRYETTLQSFKNGKQILDSLGIPADAKILVPDAYSTNAPLILLGRKGYTVQTTSEVVLKKAMQQPYDYVAVQNMFLVSDVLSGYPDMLKEMELIYDDSNFSLFRKRRASLTQLPALNSFLGIDSTKSFYFSENFEDSPPHTGFSNINYSEKRKLSGQHSAVVNPETEYGFSFDFPENNFQAVLKTCRLLFKGNFYFENEIKNLSLVVSVDGVNGNNYYHSFNLKDYIYKTNEWQYVQIQFAMIPLAGNRKLKCYLYNNDRGEVYCDDISIIIY